MVTGTTFTAVLLLSLLSCVSAGFGVALALALRGNARALAAGMGFSAGIMILVAVLELVPQSIADAGIGASLASAGSGAAAIWLAHFLIPHMHLVSEKGIARRMLARSAYLVSLGLILHDVGAAANAWAP
jgi:ZIP family zinc transporter